MKKMPPLLYMKYFLLIFGALSILCWYSCNKEHAPAEQFEDALTFEMTIGVDSAGFPSEFIITDSLAAIAVNDSGDIFLTEGFKVKVFDRNGNPKTILGFGEQKSNEFGRVVTTSVGPEGHIGVINTDGFRIFSPGLRLLRREYGFNEKKYDNVEKSEWSEIPQLIQTVPFGSREWVFEAEVLTETETSPDRNDALFFENRGAIRRIVLYRDKKNFKVRLPYGSFELKLNFNGELLWDVVSQNMIVFTHPFYNTTVIQGRQNYTLYFLSLDSFTKTTINQSYEPVRIPDAEIVKIRRYMNYFRNLEMYPVIRDQILAEVRYRTNIVPLQKLLADRDIVFAFTYSRTGNGLTQADIFDALEMRFLHSVYFSVIPDRIRNGYAYKLILDGAPFRHVKKYKIASSVYSK